MGLTQVSTDGVKNDAITKTKIPANQIEASELADNAVDTNAIADQAVALSKLPHGDGSSNGKFLRANNGADPSFETVSIPAGTTINNNADNRVITGSGTANTLEGESDLTYDGTNLSIPNGIIHTGDTNTAIRFPANDHISMESAGSEVFRVTPDEGHGTSHSIRLKSAHTVDGAAVCMGGTKAYSAGIIRGMANIRDGNAYNVTDNGGGIGFSAVFNSGGSHTTMSQIEGVKANNTDGNYEGAIKFSTRHHNGNMVEKVRIGQEGLSFEGATAAANCLDDYEEGTFTPTMRGNNTNSTGPITGAGKYTKIGRICHVQYSFQNKPSGDLPSGEYIQIHGLPFTASGYSQVAPYGMNYKIGFNNSYQYYMYIPANGTIMWGYYNSNGGAYQPWGTDQWRQSSSNIYHETTFTYMVS